MADDLQRRLIEHLRDVSRRRGVALSHIADRAGVSRSHFWDVMRGEKSPTLDWVSRIANALETDPGLLLQAGRSPAATHAIPKPVRGGTAAAAPAGVPLYTLKAAAGALSASQEARPDGWIVPRTRQKLGPDFFAAQVEGASMEPLIPDGALCLFRRVQDGTAEGRVVLVQHRDIRDVETGGSYTVKRLRRKKKGDRTVEIRLESINAKFKPIVLREEPGVDVRIVAEFVQVLSPQKHR